MTDWVPPMYMNVARKFTAAEAATNKARGLLIKDHFKLSNLNRDLVKIAHSLRNCQMLLVKSALDTNGYKSIPYEDLMYLRDTMNSINPKVGTICPKLESVVGRVQVLLAQIENNPNWDPIGTGDPPDTSGEQTSDRGFLAESLGEKKDP